MGGPGRHRDNPLHACVDIRAEISRPCRIAVSPGLSTLGPPRVEGLNLAKTKILAKYNTVSEVERLYGDTKLARAAWETGERGRFAVTRAQQRGRAGCNTLFCRNLMYVHRPLAQAASRLPGRFFDLR
jgi:hypothetical protein